MQQLPILLDIIEEIAATESIDTNMQIQNECEKHLKYGNIGI